MQLEELKAGVRISGIVPGEAVAVVAVSWHGLDAVELTYKRLNGELAQQLLYRADESRLALADADANDFKLVAEIQRTKLAGLFEPMLAVATSDVQRCLIVASGGLVEQWRDELFFKFGLRFEILTTQLVEASAGSSVFEHHPLLISRMGQLREPEWDLVMVDEAHWMGAHYFVGKYKQGIHAASTNGVIHRMVKEDLLAFEGKWLFPKRVAQTAPYELTPPESELYEQGTDYVREGMNQAGKLDGERRNPVGFALT